MLSDRRSMPPSPSPSRFSSAHNLNIEILKAHFSDVYYEWLWWIMICIYTVNDMPCCPFAIFALTRSRGFCAAAFLAFRTLHNGAQHNRKHQPATASRTGSALWHHQHHQHHHRTTSTITTIATQANRKHKGRQAGSMRSSMHRGGTATAQANDTQRTAKHKTAHCTLHTFSSQAHQQVAVDSRSYDGYWIYI